jgi:hypothetical protein
MACLLLYPTLPLPWPQVLRLLGSMSRAAARPLHDKDDRWAFLRTPQAFVKYIRRAHCSSLSMISP